MTTLDLSEFAPYVVRASAWERQALQTVIDAGCAPLAADLGAPFELFERVVADLTERADRPMVSVDDHVRGEPGVCVRVDVDMDIGTAVRMAETADGRLPVTFYVLHTSSYYGAVTNGVFERHEAMAGAYLELQTATTEVGLHVDGLSLYLDHGIDGSQAVDAELTWLRGLGLAVRGTSAHNCAPVYGAENFELFSGRRMRDEVLVRDGVRVPLGTLDEQALGLTHEAGAATQVAPGPRSDEWVENPPPANHIADATWLRSYMIDNPHCRWSADVQVWAIGPNRWAIGQRGSDGSEWFSADETWTSVMDRIQGLDPDTRVQVTLHPIYFGRRL